MTLSSRHLITALVVAVFLAINIVAIQWSSGFFRSTPVLLKYGSSITKLEGQRLLGKDSVEPSANRSSLVLYFSSTKAPGLSPELLRYAEILSQQYGKQGLGVTVVVPGDVPELQSLIKHSLVNYNVIADKSGQIGGKLGLGPNENGVFLFDQQGVCKFSTRRPVSAGDLRQLVSLEFLNVDPFSNPAAGQQILQRGKAMGSWSLFNVRSWEQTSLDKIRSGATRRFVFFTAECSVCSLPAYIEDFAKIERGEQANSDSAKATALVFDFNFPPAELLDQLNLNGIKAPAYLATEELSAVVDVVKTELNDEPVVYVDTDEQGRVVEIAPLHSLSSPQTGASVVASKAQQAVPNKSGPFYEQVFHDLPLSAYDVAVHQGRYVLTDFNGNRVFIVKEDMQVEREFGRIGSGPGRLLNPGFIDVARDGTIYVNDGGNERIVKFSFAGEYLGEFPLSEYEGMAVGPENEVYVGQSHENQLITVYSGAGKKLRSFGQLKKYSEIYGANFADKDALYKTALNQVRLAVDKDGNLFVSFMLIPLIQKYSPQGKLLFERKLEAPEIDRLMESIQKRKYLTANREGADGRVIALDPVIEPATGNIFVPLVDGSVYMADRDGNKLAFLHPQWPPQPSQTFYPYVAGLGAKGELLLTPFPPKRWYRLVITPSSVDRRTAE